MGVRDAMRALVVRDASHRTSPQNVPSTAALTFQERGRVGKANVQLFRNWAEHSEWVRAAINVRKHQVSAAEWDIVPFDKANPTISSDLQARVKRLFNMPNPQLDSFRSFIEPVIEDLLVLDGGVIEKVRNMRGMPAQMWGVDAGKVRINSLWDGSVPEEPRYYWYPDGVLRATFRNEDMVYMMANPSTYRVVGLAPLETLKMTVDAELAGHAYNHRMVINAAPDGMLDLGEGARKEQVDEFKSYWQAEVAGKGAMAFIGGTKNAKFVPFRSTNREMQFLEWQIYLVRKISAVFGLSPQDLGITFDINRANAEQQQENTEDRGLRPLLALIQEYLTREVVWDPAFGGSDNNLAFRFTRLNLKESLSRAQMFKLGLAGVSWLTVNEVRMADGREPLEGDQYDDLMVITPTGAVSLADVPTAMDALGSKTIKGQEVAPEPPPAPAAPPKTPPATKELEAPHYDELIDKLVASHQSSMEAIKKVAEPAQINVDAQTFISEGAIKFSAPPVEVHQPNIEVHTPEVVVNQAPIEIQPAQVTIEKGAVQVDVVPPQAPSPEPRQMVHKRVVRDEQGRITEVVEQGSRKKVLRDELGRITEVVEE